MTDWSITLKSVVKTYRGRAVLDIPELTLRSGGGTALIGANGSGKSTLLRLLSGATKPSAGEIVMEGIAPEDIGYLPQRPYAFSVSALKSLMMAGADRESARRLLDAVGLSELADSRGDRLSGGEAQRLAVARLLARPGKLLILDEPTSSTDIPGGVLVESVLRSALAERGCTLIIATHAPAQAERLAEETLFLNAGRVMERGPAKKLLTAPETPELRAFLDYM